MNFFIYSGEYDTPTDGVIYEGCRNILNSIYPDSTFKYLPKSNRFLRDCSILPDSVFHPTEKFDAIIIPGSPFLWHYFHTTDKIKNLQKLMKIHDCPVISMGIGSCLPLENYHLLNDIPHQKAVKEIFGKTLVISRDSLASKILTTANVEHTSLLCPSYFATLETEFKKTKDSLLVWYEPSIGLSKGNWNTEKLQEYYRLNTEFQQKYNADVVCKDHAEIAFAEKIGLPTPRLLEDVRDTLETVSEYDTVLSGRVRIGVPALISKCNVGIIPIDSRYLTIDDWCDNSVVNFDQIQRIKGLNVDRESHLECYQYLIRTHLK